MLNKKQKYLQIALNSTLEEAQKIINILPIDKRILIEVGTPLIKTYGIEAIRKIRNFWAERVLTYGIPATHKREAVPTIEDLLKYLLLPSKFQQSPKKDLPLFPYIVADLKCMDRGPTEVELAKWGGADGAVVLGQAPIETINAFIEKCEKENIDSMVDMMNVEFPLKVLRALDKLPKVVILHRGVDEESFSPDKEIPFYEIARIKNEYDLMVAVAGGDTIQEVQRAIFNGADIVVVWKSFYKSSTETAKLAEDFLKEIK